MDTFGDAATIVMTTVSLAISAAVIVRSGRIGRDARKEFIAHWQKDGDPEYLAHVMARVGWLERRRLKRELGDLA